jgi:hypothetical protein
MRLIVITILLFTQIFDSSAQQGQIANSGAKSIAMGRISSTLQGAEAIFGNPGALDYTKSIIVHLATEQRFLLPGLSSASIGLSKKLNRTSAFSVAVSNFGIEEYKEINAKVNYSRKIIDKLHLGIGFNYYQIRIEEYGNKSLFNADIGLFSKIAKEVQVGFYLKNPFRTELAEGYNLPTSIHLGGTYQPSAKSKIHLEFEKQIDFEEQIKFGMEYDIRKEFSLRAGFRTNPASASFGFALNLKNSFSIQVGFDTHPYLDISPGMSLMYQR